MANLELDALLKLLFGLMGGLGIFLLGMKNMSDGMQAVAGGEPAATDWPRHQQSLPCDDCWRGGHLLGPIELGHDSNGRRIRQQ